MLATIALYLALQASLTTSECVDSFLQVGNPVKGVKTDTPMTWVEIDALCTRTHVGYKLIQKFDGLGVEEKEFCGSELVPFGVYEFYDTIYWALSFGISMKQLTEAELTSMDHSFPIPKFGNGVLNLTTGLWHLVDEQVLYNCALCQAQRSLNIQHYPLYPVAEPLPSWHNRYDIKLTKKNTSNTDLNEEDKLKIGREVGKALNISENAIFQRFFTNKEGFLELHYRLDVYPLPEEVFKKSLIVLDEFEMTLTDVSECKDEWLVGYEGDEEKWPSSHLGSIRVTMNASTAICSRRECTWNSDPDVERPEWSPPTYWTIQWAPCTDEEQYENDNTFSHLLGATLHAKYLDRLKTLANSTVKEDSLNEVVKITSREMMRRNKISQDMNVEVANILANVVLDQDKVSCMKEENRMHIIVVDLKGSEPPAVGFALPLAEELTVGAKHKATSSFDRVTPQLERNLSQDIGRRSQFVAAVSEKLIEHGSRLAFAVDLKDASKEPKPLTYEKSKSHDIEVTIVLKLKKITTALMLDDASYYVDIMYQTLPDRHNVTVKCACAAWTPQTNWTTKGCRALGQNAAVEHCRCRAKYFTLNQGVLSGLYGMKNNNFDAKRSNVFNFIGNHPTLMAALLINMLFAIFSLIIIVLTAFFFNIWIINGSNKTMLNTTMALLINLVLNVTASLVEFDTDSASCTAFGAIRHYTFLAMFLWLLVMSSCQVNKLMTEQSGKPPSESVLKVSLFAWIVPVAPIGLLLLSNPRIYRYDRFDRGYCYPDGYSFELTVLTPVGFILLVTIGVFIVTVAHIFEFCKKTKKIASRSEIQDHVRQLKKSVVIYLLFCLLLAFHFFAEMREVRDEFLFEYLFLFTLTGLFTVFAVLYIGMEDYAASFWRDSCKKLLFQFTRCKET